MSEQQKATQWDAEPAYIGDDVYQGIDIVTDIDDIDGNPLVVCVQNGSKAQDEEVAGRIINAVNSYARHFGPDAVKAAEDDVLGQALRVLRGYFENREGLRHNIPGEDPCCCDVCEAARVLLSQLPQESPR